MTGGCPSGVHPGGPGLMGLRLLFGAVGLWDRSHTGRAPCPKDVLLAAGLSSVPFEPANRTSRS